LEVERHEIAIRDDKRGPTRQHKRAGGGFSGRARRSLPPNEPCSRIDSHHLVALGEEVDSGTNDDWRTASFARHAPEEPGFDGRVSSLGE
jgi:hypothetical protein